MMTMGPGAPASARDRLDRVGMKSPWTRRPFWTTSPTSSVHSWRPARGCWPMGGHAHRTNRLRAPGSAARQETRQEAGVRRTSSCHQAVRRCGPQTCVLRAPVPEVFVFVMTTWRARAPLVETTPGITCGLVIAVQVHTDRATVGVPRYKVLSPTVATYRGSCPTCFGPVVPGDTTRTGPHGTTPVARCSRSTRPTSSTTGRTCWTGSSARQRAGGEASTRNDMHRFVSHSGTEILVGGPEPGTHLLGVMRRPPATSPVTRQARTARALSMATQTTGAAVSRRRSQQTPPSRHPPGRPCAGRPIAASRPSTLASATA